MNYIKSFKTFEEFNSNKDSFGGYDDAQIREIEKTVAELYNSVRTGVKSNFSKLKSFFAKKPKQPSQQPTSGSMLPVVSQNKENEENYIGYINANFDYMNWQDSRKAKDLVSMAQMNIKSNGDIRQLKDYCEKINNLIER